VISERVNLSWQSISVYYFEFVFVFTIMIIEILTGHLPQNIYRILEFFNGNVQVQLPQIICKKIIYIRLTSYIFLKKNIIVYEKMFSKLLMIYIKTVEIMSHNIVIGNC
jgi:hypothetical protein